MLTRKIIANLFSNNDVFIWNDVLLASHGPRFYLLLFSFRLFACVYDLNLTCAITNVFMMYVMLKLRCPCLVWLCA